MGNQGIDTFNRRKALTIDLLPDLHGSLAGSSSENAMTDPPRALKILLLGHQIYSLAWMICREKKKPRSGILADDMGLGKTLSMISLIIKSKELEDEENKGSYSTENDKKNDDNDYNDGELLLFVHQARGNQ